MCRILKPVALIITKTKMEARLQVPTIKTYHFDLKSLIYSTTHVHEALKAFFGPGCESHTIAGVFQMPPVNCFWKVKNGIYQRRE